MWGRRRERGQKEQQRLRHKRRLADISSYSVALIVQIHLAMNRLDLAQQEVRKARNWAQDHLLVNLAEAWVGLREVTLDPVAPDGGLLKINDTC